MRVMVVDDDEALVRSTTMLLREMGHEAMGLQDWRKAPEAAAWFRPQVLLQDVHMPGLDVGHLVERLREDKTQRALRVVLFSGSLDLDEVAEKIGADAALEKPVRPDDLLALLH